MSFKSIEEDKYSVIESRVPYRIFGHEICLVTIMDYRELPSHIGKVFSEKYPNMDIIIDSFACGANGDFRFIRKRLDEEKWQYYIPLKDKGFIEFANNILKENIEKRQTWAVSNEKIKKLKERFKWD